MKRALLLILAMVYFAASSGFTLHLHYCMGHFVNASLTAGDEEHECGHCGMKKKKGGNGCCRDEHKVMKASADHSPAKQIQVPLPAVVAGLPPEPVYVPFAAACVSATSRPAFSAHAPPGDPDCPIYLRLRNLRL